MSDLPTVTRLLAQARAYGLSGVSFVDAVPLEQVAQDYNGIGPSWFPDVLRRAIDRLSPDLCCCALIHDVRWAHNPGTVAAFNASNAELEANGLIVARTKYGWYDPRVFKPLNQSSFLKLRLFSLDALFNSCMLTKGLFVLVTPLPLLCE